jgi:hypothetical protein
VEGGETRPLAQDHMTAPTELLRDMPPPPEPLKLTFLLPPWSELSREAAAESWLGLAQFQTIELLRVMGKEAPL